MRAPRLRTAPTLPFALACVLAACGGADATGPDDDRLRIVTTVAPITSIVAAVVGEHARVDGIVPEGTNSHTFDPPPSVAELLVTADVVILNGLLLEEPTKQLALANLPADAELVELGDEVLTPSEHIYDFSFPREEGKPNPHLWTDPTLARRYAGVVRDVVTRRDPANADHYAAGYDAFAEAVDRLDTAMRESFATLPVERRRLLTYHDAYAYFARTYDWEVIGAIQVSDFQDPSPREVADLIDQIAAEQVPVIFGSEVFPSPVLEQIGRETGVRYVDVLRDDDLPGEPGDPEHSWLGLMRFDYATMVDALGGDASAIEAVDLSGLPADAASYPQ